MEKRRVIACVFVLTMAMSIVVMSQEETRESELEVFYDFRGIPMVFVPLGTAQIGVTLEDALDLCEAHIIADQYPSCGRTTYGIQVVETSRQDPFEIAVEAFYIDQFEVSRSDYIVCVEVDVCDNFPLMRQTSDPTDTPVQYVTYYDAAVYCAWREARLPTEIEWEYAARGPEGLTFPWGNEFDGNLVNHCDVNCTVIGDAAFQSDWDDGYSELAPVDSFEGGQSWIGVYNISGNIQEWTSSRSALNSSPTGDIKVVKGGSYDGYPYQTAGWIMNHFSASQGSANIGFRCVRTTEP